MRFWGNFFLISLLVSGVVVFLEILSFNHNAYFDLTPGKIHSFSDQTKKILRSLEKEVEFIAFYRLDDRSEINDFFQRLCDISPKLRYRLIDLERNPGKAELYGVDHTQAFVEYDGKRKIIPYPTEERIVNAILRLVRDTTKTVYFSKGHGEYEGYSDLKQDLKTQNWKSGDIYLNKQKDIPYHETVLLIAAPERDLQENEKAVMDKYLGKGGKIVMLLEPFTRLPNLEDFLKKYHMALSDGIIVDEEHKLSGGDYLAPLVFPNRGCSFVRQLASYSVFSTVRSLEIMEGDDDMISATSLARTSRESWTKTNKEDVKKGNIDFQEGIDTPGPLEVAVWVRITGEDNGGKKTEGELICFGDSDFIKDSYYNVFANKDLFLNTLEWLARDKDLISIRPKKIEYPFHFLNVAQGRLLFWVSIIVLPAIFLIISVAIFMFRRVRG